MLNSPKFYMPILMVAAMPATAEAPFPIPDTMQSACYSDIAEITCPDAEAVYFGQDAQHDGTQPSYTDNGDGTVTDNITGLMWAKSPDLNNDGDIRADGIAKLI